MAKVQKDKKQHFGVCMIATLVAAVVNRWQAALIMRLLLQVLTLQ